MKGPSFVMSKIIEKLVHYNHAKTKCYIIQLEFGEYLTGDILEKTDFLSKFALTIILLSCEISEQNVCGKQFLHRFYKILLYNQSINPLHAGNAYMRF